MELNPEYIEFKIADIQKFEDMKRVYDLIAEAKNSGEPKPDKFWIENFPSYSLKHFFFLKTDLKPDFETAKKEKNIWHFYAMTNLLQLDLDVEFIGCERTGEIGRLEFSSNGYPYGGITGLTLFLNSFDCKALKIDEGGGIYKVKWISNDEFQLTEIKTPAKVLKAETGESVMEKKANISTFWSKIKRWWS